MRLKRFLSALFAAALLAPAVSHAAPTPGVPGVPKAFVPSICTGANPLSAALCMNDGNGGEVPLIQINPSLHTVVTNPVVPLGGFGSVSNTAALKAIKQAVMPISVGRLGYASPGDGGAAQYTYSPVACAAPDNGLQITAATGGCWVAAIGTNRSPKLFGAVGDGVTDDSIALTSWAASVTPYSDLFTDPGNYAFSVPIKFPVVDHVHISGRGAVLLYTGSNTNTDLVTVGNPNDTARGNCSVTDWTVEDLSIQSNTKMTGGDAWKLNDTCKSRWRNPTTGIRLNPNGNLWNGVHGNGGNNLHVFEPGGGAQNDAVLLNGDPQTQFTDPWVGGGGLLVGSKVGAHVAGNVGGFMLDDLDILGNTTNLLIDQSQVPLPNSQVFLSSSVFLDINSGHDIEIADAGGGESYLSIQGAWIAGAQNGSCVQLDPGTKGWRVEMVGGSIRNCAGPGISNGGANLVETSGTYMDNMIYGLDNSAGLGTMTQCGVRYSARMALGQTNGPVPTTCGADGNAFGKGKALYAGLRGFGNTAQNGGSAGGSIAALVPGSQQGEVPEISLYGTFKGTADNGPRRAADLTASFGGIWGSEFACIGVGVGNGGSNDAENPNTPRMCLTATGHETIGQGAVSPTLTGCGASPPSVIGTDRAGMFTTGSGAGGCTLNFGAAYASEPICTVTGEGGVALNYTKTNARISFLGISGGVKVDYHCTAQVGG